MKKLNKLIVHCASSIVHQSKTLTLLLVMLMSVNMVWGDTYSWTLAQNDLGTTDSPATSVAKGSPSKTWTVAWTWKDSGKKFLGWDTNNSRGVQVGKGTADYGGTVVVLSTSGISGTITNITVGGAIVSDGGANVSVSVGGTQFKYNTTQTTANLTTSQKTYSFEGSASGKIVITYTNTKTSKAMYISSIEVTYSAAPAVPVTSLILSEAGTETDYKSGKNVGDKYPLPDEKGVTAECGDKTFVGWSTETVDSPTKPTSKFYEPGEEVTLAANNTFYAVFADESASGGASGTDQIKKSDWGNQGTQSSGSAMSFTTTNGIVVSSTKGYYGGTNPFAQFYGEDKITITPASGMTITKIVFTANGTSNNGWQSSGEVTANIGNIVGSTTETATTWTGSATSAIEVSHDKQMRLITIDITYGGGKSYSNYTTTCAAPKEIDHISVTGTPATFWKGDDFNHTGMTVKAYYTEGDPDDVTSKAEFSTPDMTTAGEKTVTVTYKDKTDTYDIDVKTIANTAETAYTTAQAIALIDANKDLTTKVYVKGTVSKVDDYYYSKYITYFLDEDAFEIYNGLGKEGVAFSSIDDIQVDDDVVVYGQLTKHNSIYEFTANNYLVSLSRTKKLTWISVSGTPDYFDTSMEFNHNGMTVKAHYNTGASDDAVVTESAEFIAPDMTTEGTKQVTVKYTEGGITVEAYYDITIDKYCANVVEISKGEEVNGTFDLSETGNLCADGGLTISVTNIEPAEHYHFKEITTTNGTVNDKTVTGITDDAIITVVFEEDTKYELKWMVSGNQMGETVKLYEGADITAPTATVTVPTTCANEGKVFVGWTADTNVDPETAPTFFAPHKIGAANETYYAVFASVSGAGSTTVLHSQPGTITSGDYYLIDTYGGVDYQGNETGDYWALQGGVSNKAISAVDVTNAISVNEGILTLNLENLTTETTPSVYTITLEDDSVSFALKDGDVNIYNTGDNVNANLQTAKAYRWKSITDETGEYAGRHMLYVSRGTGSRCLMYMDHTSGSNGASQGNEQHYCKMYALTNSNFGGTKGPENSYGSGKLYFIPATTVSYTDYITTCCTQLPAPVVVVDGEVETNKATIKWNAITGATGYQYSADQNTWTDFTLTSKVLSGLNPNTEYTYYVRATCTTGDYCTNGEVGSVTFTTKPLTVNITFDAATNGGTIDGEGTKVLQYAYNGEALTLPTPDERTGYHFNGWFTSKTGSTQVTNVGGDNKPTEDKTYFAQWTQLKLYTITYSVPACVDAEPYAEGTSQYEGISVDLKELPENVDDWECIGWSTENPATATTTKPEILLTSLTDGLTGNMTVYAIYQKGEDLPTGEFTLSVNYNNQEYYLCNLYSSGGYFYARTEGNGTPTVFQIEEEEGKKYLYKQNGETKTYYSYVSGKEEDVDEDQKREWTIEQNTNGTWSFKPNSRNLCFSYNSGNTPRFKYYTPSDTYLGNLTKHDIIESQALYTTVPCLPECELSVSGNVHLTTGKDITVYTTTPAENVITISAPHIDRADYIQCTFLNESGVVGANAPFALCENTDTYAKVTNGRITTTDLIGEFNRTYAISYKPSVANHIDNYTLQLKAYDDEKVELSTCTLAISGRSLPEQFVIAVKSGNQWLAVPNTLSTTAAAAPKALPIEVYTDENGDYAVNLLDKNAPNCLYSAAEHATGPTWRRGGIRFQSVATEKFITASYSNVTSFYMPDNNADAQQFYLTSTDLKKYTVTLDPGQYTDNTPTRWMSLYSGQLGWFTTSAKEIYFLPVGDYVRELSNDQIGTLCLPFDVKAGNFTGADFYEMSYKELDAQGNPFRLYYEEQVETLTAGKAYIFVPTDSRITCKKEAEAEINFESLDPYKGFIGTFDTITPAEDNDLVGKYMVVNNIFQKCGINCGLLPYRAYIDMESVPTKEQLTQAPTRRLLIMGKDRIEYVDPTPGISTGSEDINASEMVQKMIINDKMYILRAGRIYNAAGTLVK